ENIPSIPGVNNQHKQNKFVPLSEGVTACTVHPLNGTIVAGTKQASLLLISQKHMSFQGRGSSLGSDEDCKKPEPSFKNLFSDGMPRLA
ncbi:unnamed protein product, partial [Ilex paraguariensis]